MAHVFVSIVDMALAGRGFTICACVHEDTSWLGVAMAAVTTRHPNVEDKSLYHMISHVVMFTRGITIVQNLTDLPRESSHLITSQQVKAFRDLYQRNPPFSLTERQHKYTDKAWQSSPSHVS